jgi:hypothetical protein
MTVTAKVICDSVSPEGVRLTTLHCRYPRMVHGEVMTHRAFSRNGRSSRAVPVLTLLQEEPYLPEFLTNKSGMVGGEPLTGEALEEANALWLGLAAETKRVVGRLNELKVHKQHANRPLEWFGYIDVLITSTDWSNWNALRDEDGAQPEIIQLAKRIKSAMRRSKPDRLMPGDWHLPYIEDKDYNAVDEMFGDACMGCIFNSDYCTCKEETAKAFEVLKKISVARCARLTIKPFDGDGSIEKELKRYNLLMVSKPVHASPAEHIATPDELVNPAVEEWKFGHEHGNFYGWRQFRKMIPSNTIYDR